jgi:hypothetical protein
MIGLERVIVIEIAALDHRGAHLQPNLELLKHLGLRLLLGLEQRSLDLERRALLESWSWSCQVMVMVILVMVMLTVRHGHHSHGHGHGQVAAADEVGLGDS